MLCRIGLGLAGMKTFLIVKVAQSRISAKFLSR